MLPMECHSPPHFYLFFLFAELLSPAAASEHVLLALGQRRELVPVFACENLVLLQPLFKSAFYLASLVL